MTSIPPLATHDGLSTSSQQPTKSRLGRILRVGDRNERPMLLEIRSSIWFIGLTVGVGLMVDLAAYGLISPVVPFRLMELGYNDVSALTGWLLAVYGAGLIISSVPMGIFGEMSSSRRLPLLIGLMCMAGSMVMFMLSRTYALMIVARILQGFSGTVIWTLGLALVCDSVPQDQVGIVLGYVMIGFTVGGAIGPVAGGSLYARQGYYAPFIFGLALVGFDFALRFVVVERKDRIKWIPDRDTEGGVHGLSSLPRNLDAQGGDGKVEMEAADPELDYTTKGATKDREQSPHEGGRQMDDSVGRDQITPATQDASPSVTGVRTTGERDQISNHQSQDDVEPDLGRESQATSTFKALCSMMSSPRAWTVCAITCLNGFIIGAMIDTGMTLRLNQRYGLDSLGAGLVFLAAVVPSFFSSPIAGWISDKYGAKWIGVITLLASVAPPALLCIEGPLWLFILFLVLEGFCLSAYLAPIMQDLSQVVLETPGLGYSHVYAFFNLSYSVGTFIGPIVSGQILENLGIRKGWFVLCGISSFLALCCVPFAYLYMGGDITKGSKGRKEMERRHSSQDDAASSVPV